MSVSGPLSEGLHDLDPKAFMISSSSSSDEGNGLVRGPIEKKSLVGRTVCSAGVCTYTGADIEPDSHTMEEKVGVLLLNLGGPETLDDVQPFLFNLFADPVHPLHNYVFFSRCCLL